MKIILAAISLSVSLTGCATGAISLMPESMKTTVSDLGAGRYEVFARSDFKNTDTKRFEGKASDLCTGGYTIEEKNRIPEEKAVKGIVKCN